MSTISLEKIFESFESTIDDNNVMNDNGLELYHGNLPNNLKVDDLVALSNYRREFSSLYTDRMGRQAIAHMKDNKDVDEMLWDLKTEDVSFRGNIARPNHDDDLTKYRTNCRSSIGIGVAVCELDTTNDVVDALTGLWDHVS